jgi:energy-coupling factor transporter ATP-binding protein EcfA2
MIDIQNLTVQYHGQEPAVDGVSLKIEQGEFVLLTGPSGCGKSTLTRCLNGLIPQSSQALMSGRVFVDGIPTVERTVAQTATHVGLVFQNPASQLFGSTVEEELAFGPRNLGLPENEVAERSSFALQATAIEHLRRRATRTLSGGEQQRVAIAAVLAMRPRVLVLDEPTSNLDLKGATAVLNTLHRLHTEYGLTILVVEHRLAEAGKLADRVLIMDRGRMVLDGSPQEVFANKGLLAKLGIRYPRPAPKGSCPALDPAAWKSYGAARRPLVELQSVEAGYDSRVVLKDLDLTIYGGEFVALVGDNGAGKTTVARLLAGLLKPRRGCVAWDDGSARLSLGRRVGLLFQNPLDQLFCDTVEEEIAFGPRNLGTLEEERLQTITGAAGLSDLRSRNPYALSVGQQQRVALASVLSLEPALLVLDEPTMGQDWGSLSRAMDFLSKLNDHGQAILLITHDHKLVCHYAQRILRLEDGTVSRVTPNEAQYAVPLSEYQGEIR